jgi:hypothetical protein
MLRNFADYVAGAGENLFPLVSKSPRRRQSWMHSSRYPVRIDGRGDEELLIEVADKPVARLIET